jgi:hypothetical protein
MARLFRFGMVVLGMLVLMAASDLFAARGAPTAFTRLRGAKARAYVDRLYRQNDRLRNDHEVNVRLLTSRGWKPTSGDHDVVEIRARKELPLQRVTSMFVPSLVAQSLGLGDATLVVSPWDTGDPDVFAAEVSIVGYDGTVLTGSYAMSIGSGIVQWFSKPWVQRWAICTVAGCAASATGCFLTGPGWGVCTVTKCDGAFIGCGIGEWLRHKQCIAGGKRDIEC